MIQLASAAAISLLSALAFLAYNHPRAFKKLHLPSTVFKIFIGVLITGCAYISASISTYFILAKYIPVEKVKEAIGELPVIRLGVDGFFIEIMAPLLLFWGYLWVLTELPNFLKDDKETKE
jgi:hypothetical protein